MFKAGQLLCAIVLDSASLPHLPSDMVSTSDPITQSHLTRLRVGLTPTSCPTVCHGRPWPLSQNETSSLQGIGSMSQHQDIRLDHHSTPTMTTVWLEHPGITKMIKNIHHYSIGPKWSPSVTKLYPLVFGLQSQQVPPHKPFGLIIPPDWQMTLGPISMALLRGYSCPMIMIQSWWWYAI